MIWNDQHQCLCDYMGLPLTKTEVRAYLELCKKHLKRSEMQLAASSNTILEQVHPTMAENHRRHAEDMR